MTLTFNKIKNGKKRAKQTPLKPPLKTPLKTPPGKLSITAMTKKINDLFKSENRLGTWQGPGL